MISKTCGAPGWSQHGSRVVQVAREAKAFRTTEPRFSSAAYPRRSSFGQFRLADGRLFWQRLENRIFYLDLKNQHGPIGMLTEWLLSIFEVP